MLTIGDKIPEINVIIDGNKPFKFPNRDGKNLVLYFYPKDDTPGCTKEAINFSEQTAAFETENTVILGVSRDTVTKHEKFICKHDLKLFNAHTEAPFDMMVLPVYVRSNGTADRDKFCTRSDLEKPSPRYKGFQYL